MNRFPRGNDRSESRRFIERGLDKKGIALFRAAVCLRLA